MVKNSAPVERLISIIIPIYNREQLIVDTLKAVFSQTLLPGTIIIVDDGSTDDTVKVVKQLLLLAPKTIQAEILTQANQGVSVARNRGFNEINNSGYVCFLDSDDLWPSDFLERVYSIISSSPDAVAVSTDKVNQTDKGEVLNRISTRKIGTRWLIEKNGAVASCSIFKAETIKYLKGFGEVIRSGEDKQLFLRLSLEGQWLHAPGKAVIFQRTKEPEKINGRNLSWTYPKAPVWWSETLETFINENRAKIPMSEKELRFAKAKSWCRAGVLSIRHGCREQAVMCFLKSIFYKPLQRRVYSEVLKLAFQAVNK